MGLGKCRPHRPGINPRISPKPRFRIAFSSRRRDQPRFLPFLAGTGAMFAGMRGRRVLKSPQGRRVDVTKSPATLNFLGKPGLQGLFLRRLDRFVLGAPAILEIRFWNLLFHEVQRVAWKSSSPTECGPVRLSSYQWIAAGRSCACAPDECVSPRGIGKDDAPPALAACRIGIDFVRLPQRGKAERRQMPGSTAAFMIVGRAEA